LLSGIIFATILFLTRKTIASTIFHDPSLEIYLFYFSLTIPLILISNLFLSIIKANQKILRYTFILNIFQNISRLIGIFLMIFIGLKSYAIIGSYLIGIVSLAAASYFGARRYISSITHQLDIDSIERKNLKKEFLSYSWPIIFVGFVGTVLYWVDSLVIGYLMDTTSVGIYGAAFTIVSLLGIAPELFMQMFLPVILKEYSKGNLGVINQTSKQVSKWIGLLNIPIFTIMVVFPEVIITLLFGDSYLEAAASLRILALGGFFSSFININTSLLSMKGKSKSILFTLAAASLINLVLDFFLVSIYGIEGAAIATSLVWFLTLAFLSVQVYKSTNIFAARRKLFSIFLWSLVPALIVAFLGKYLGSSWIELFTGIIIYGLLYIIIILLTKNLDKNDYFMLKKISSAIKSKNFKGVFQGAE